MFVLVVSFLYFATFHFTALPLPIDMKGEINVLPVKIISGNNCYYYNDLKTDHVICFDLNGMKYQVGGIGQGPGEYEGRVQIAYSDKRFFIFQHSKSMLMEHDDKGMLLRTLRLQQDSRASFLMCDLIIHKGHYYLVKSLTDEWVSKFDQTGALIQTYKKGLPEPYGNSGFDYRAISAENDILTLFSRFTGEVVQLDLKKGRTSKKSSIDDPLNNEGLERFLKPNKYQPGQGLSTSVRFRTILKLNNTDLAVRKDKDPAEKMKLLFEIPTSKRHYLDTSVIPFDVEYIYQVGAVFFLLSTDGDLYWIKSDAVRMKKT